MNLWKDTYPIMVSCARGMSPHTALEIQRLGYEIESVADSMVTIRQGQMRDVMRLNLWLRTAHRIMVPLLRSCCRDLYELYDDVRSIDWENLLEQDGYFTISSVVFNNTIRDTRMPSLKAKDAIADRMRMKRGGRPNSGNEYIGAAIFIYWEQDELMVYLDTTGEPLSRRGYRKLPWKAPMQETLAAGCVIASGWDGNSPFIAPMCGSGTPAIEAALIAINCAPGNFKSHFGFMSVKGYRSMIAGETAGNSVMPRFGAMPEQIWRDMVATARSQERRDHLPPIIASDLDLEAIEAARLNAIAAGVYEFITFEQCDYTATTIPPAPGIIFLNPEYGERLGEDQDLEPLYQGIGDFFKQRCSGYTGCVLTGNMEMSRKIGLRSIKRIPFYNGSIECRMVVFDLYEGSQKQEE